MGWRLRLVSGLTLMMAAAAVRADVDAPAVWASRASTGIDAAAMPALPFDQIDPALRSGMRAVLDAPTLSSHGPSETFNASGDVYRWLLDHPDRAVQLWRLLGAKVADIVDRGDGVYVWRDDKGSEVRWHTAVRTHGLHVWYAEGKVKPGLLLPLTPFRCVAVMQYLEGKDTSGLPAVKHQVHFRLKCDQGAMALATRILGASAPRLAEQYLGQLQLFYGGMAWYLYKDEKRAQGMYRRIGLAVAATGSDR
ncbi:MAG: hypothetical protein U0736_13005 [Gemmataceae bacterium]